MVILAGLTNINSLSFSENYSPFTFFHVLSLLLNKIMSLSSTILADSLQVIRRTLIVETYCINA